MTSSPSVTGSVHATLPARRARCAHHHFDAMHYNNGRDSYFATPRRGVPIGLGLYRSASGVSLAVEGGNRLEN